jgi:hypothetical protein
MSKKTIVEREEVLVAQIEKAKKSLANLQNKQKIELGSLAHKHGLHKIDLKKLGAAFKKLSEELGGGTQ